MKKKWYQVLTLAVCVGAVGGNLYATNNQLVEKVVVTNQKIKTKQEEKLSKQAILVVSTGTTYNEVRELTIDAIENKIAAYFTDYKVYSALSSQSIIKKIEARDKMDILDVEEAMQQLIEEQVDTVVIQPTYVMNGQEYEKMKEIVEKYRSHFTSISYGAPLLSSTEDYKVVADIISKEATKLKEDEAIVYMGHGTEHYANAGYAALNYVLQDLGYHQVIIGTLDSYPGIDEVIKTLQSKKIKKVKLMPFMIIAGSHANTDMAGEDKDSWKSQLEAAGFEVTCEIKGLGEYEEIHKLYIDHVQAGIAQS